MLQVRICAFREIGAAHILLAVAKPAKPHVKHLQFRAIKMCNNRGRCGFLVKTASCALEHMRTWFFSPIT